MDNHNQQPFVSAIVLAAGKGTRMNAGINKQFLTLKGKPILAHTLDAFERIPSVREIIAVISKNEYGMFERRILKKYRYTKVRAVPGGEERQESAYRGLLAVDPDCDMVMFHDGARPLIDRETILKSIEETKVYHATVVGVPAKNTIKVIDRHGVVSYTPDRQTLVEVQTPQTFDYDLIMKAYRTAIAEKAPATDDATLVERIGHPVKIVSGHYNNLKITTSEDLMTASAIIGLKRQKSL